MAAKTKARWVGTFEAVLPDGSVLVPGETVVEVGADEAQDSDHWQPTRPSKPKVADEAKGDA